MKRGKYGLRQGLYKPKYPEKYKGTVPITYRSSYELSMMHWLDRNPNCISWGSESDTVPYFDPVQQKNRTYYIDFRAIMLTESGEKVTYYIEVKPYRETVPPKESKRKKAKTILHEKTTYLTNCAKWKAATEWSRKRGGKFIIVTEKELYKNM